MNDNCKHCQRPYSQHWIGSDGAFCSSADLPNRRLFGKGVSDVKFEAEPATEYEEAGE